MIMTHGNLVNGGGGDSGVQHRSSVHFASFTVSNSGHGAPWPGAYKHDEWSGAPLIDR